MIFHCPLCQGDNNLPISSLPPGGLRTTCRHCQQSLHIAENGHISSVNPSLAAPVTQARGAFNELELDLPQEDPFAAGDLSADNELASLDPLHNLDDLGLPDLGGFDQPPPPDPFGDPFAPPAPRAPTPRPASSPTPRPPNRPAAARVDDDPLADLYGELEKIDKQKTPIQEHHYHVRRGSGKIFGPFATSHIRQMLVNQELNGSEQLSNDGQFWSPMTDWPDFQGYLPQQPEEWDVPSSSASLHTDHAQPPQRNAPRPQAALARPAAPSNFAYEGNAPANAAFPAHDNEFDEPLHRGSTKRVRSALKDENAPTSRGKGLLLLAALFGTIVTVSAAIFFMMPQEKKVVFPKIQIDLTQPFFSDGYRYYERNLLAKINLEQRRFPNHPEIPLLQSLVHALLLEHHPDASLQRQLDQTLKQLKPLAPDEPIPTERIWLNALLAQQRKQLAPARSWLDKLKSQQPKHPTIPYLEMKFLFLQGKIPQTISAAQTITQQNKRFARALYILGLALQKQKKTQEAFQAFYNATLVSEQSPHLPSFLQLFEMESSLPNEKTRFDTLWKESQKAFQIRNTEILAHYHFLQAQRLRAKEELKASYEALKKAIALHPTNPRYKQAELPYFFATRDYKMISKKLSPLLNEPKPHRERSLYLLRTLFHTQDWKTGRDFAIKLNGVYPNDARLLFWQGIFEEGNRVATLAFASYSKALQLKPTFAAAFLGQLRTAYKSGQKDLVAKLADQVEQCKIKDIDDRLGIIRWYFLQNNFLEASKYVQDALKALPGDEILHKQAGQIALALRDPAKAQHHFQQALKIFPEDKPSLYGIAQAFEQQGMLDQALTYYRKFLEQTRNEDANALFRTGRILFAQKKYDDAERALERALSFNDRLAPAYYYLARSMEMLKRADLQKIQRNYEQAIQHEPNERRYQYRLATFFYQNQKPNQALAIYTKLLGLKGQDKKQIAEVHLARGTLFFEARLWQRAIADFQKALRLDPELIKAHEMIGDAFANQSQHKRATLAYTQALRFLKGKPRAKLYGKIGDMYRDQNQMPKAIVYYRQAIRQDPKLADAYRRLGYALKDRKQWRECISALNQFIKLASPDNPDVREAQIDVRACQNAIYEER